MKIFILHLPPSWVQIFSSAPCFQIPSKVFSFYCLFCGNRAKNCHSAITKTVSTVTGFTIYYIIFRDNVTMQVYKCPMIAKCQRISYTSIELCTLSFKPEWRKRGSLSPNCVTASHEHGAVGNKYF